ncbi:MAG: UDP-N-acetylglucosamine 1-carboxyvinyltransferase [Aquificota bacterium]|nr:MAG: UDP-N-acetylglucosamine 1-carboxyvinyltransferase [Aquificota bacterium]
MINTTSYTSESLIIEGGCKLKGKVRISGSKNASLPIIMSTLLTNKSCHIEDVPDLLDVKNSLELLRLLGAEVVQSSTSLTVDASKVNSFIAPDHLVRKMRASVLAMGPLLARFKKAVVAMPGGCSIGVRAIDQHLKVFEKAGAHIKVQHGYIHLELKDIKPVEYTFEVVTVTGTENALMFLSMCEKRSILRNIAIEPEVMDLIEVLRKMGANIQVEGKTAIIRGSSELGGFTHRVIPDRIEAGTFLVAGFMTKGDIELENVRVDHLGSVIEKLKEAGACIEVCTTDRIRIYSKGNGIRPLSISTLEYPGFPTDMQAQFMSMCCLADGWSDITENIFENRFQHVAELKRMGADIHVKGRTAFVRGVEKLTGAEVFSTDLRASASLVLAGLVAEGETIVRDIYHLDRGYERLDEKLRNLGAVVERQTSYE